MPIRDNASLAAWWGDAVETGDSVPSPAESPIPFGMMGTIGLSRAI